MAAQVLTILFPLAGKKASAAEKKRISQIENELDAQLMVMSLTAPYFGNYKGSDTFENHYRMFVTCPDAEKLARKLMPWLKCTYQTDQIIAVKRFGDLNDPDVPEETLDLS